MSANVVKKKKKIETLSNISEATMQEKTIKSILRSFELVSGLKINFGQSG